MSSIDNRIVQMQFENSQFEKGVAESTKSLEKFKKSLDFKEAGNNNAIENMSNSVNTLADRFSVLGIIGKRVLENLADSAYRMGINFVKSVSIDQITSGWEKYASKTKAVQQIVNSTGLSISEVGEQLEKLNWFTDETSYSFTDMVSNIGKFTSMNIPLDKSVTAMQGISTWAALSGAGVQEASRAMYNLSQAIGLGSVKMQDWKSIALANMATAEFKQTAIDTAVAMGKLKKGAVNLNDFESTLSKGWFTSDVLMAVLEKYGEAANEVYKVATENGVSAAQAMDMLGDKMNTLGGKAFKAAQEAKTFQEAIEATKDAVSSNWMNIFENIFGNYEEAKVVWTDLANGLWEVFAAPLSDINDEFTKWNEMGGRTALLEGIYDIFSALYGIIQAVRDAIADIFPPVTAENLMNISNKVKEFGANLKELLWWCEIATKTLSFEDPFEDGAENVKEFTGELKRGARGDEVKELQQKLKDLGYDLGAAGVDGIFGPKTEAALKAYQEAIGEVADGIYKESTFEKLFGINAKKKAWKTEYITKYGSALKKLQSIVRGVAAVFDIFLRVVRFIGSAFLKVIGVFKPVGNMLLTIGDALSRLFVAFDTRLKNSNKFNEWLEKLDKLLSPVKEKISQLCQQFLDLLGIGGDLDEIDFDKVIDNIINSVKSFFGFNVDPNSVGEGIDVKGIVEKIKAKIISIYTSVRDWIVGLFSGGEGAPGTEGSGLNFDGYNIALGAITLIIGVLGTKLLQVVSVIVNAGKNINKILKHIDGAIKSFKAKQQASNFEVVAEAVLKFAIAIGILAGSFYIISKISWEGIAKGAVVLTFAAGLLIGMVFALKAASKKFKNMEEVSKSLIMLAAAVAAMGIVVMMLGQLEWDQIGRGLVSIAVLLGLAIGAIAILNKLKMNVKEVSGIIGILGTLAGTLGAFANVVKKLGEMKPGVLIQGLFSLAAVMGVIAIFLKAIKTIKIDWGTVASILVMAIAIDMLIAGFIALVMVMKVAKASEIIKAAVALGILITAVFLIMKALNRMAIVSKGTSAGSMLSSAASLLLIAFAIDLLIAGFIALVMVMKVARAGDIIKAAIVVGLIIGALALLAKVLKKAVPMMKSVGFGNIIAAAGALLLLAVALDVAVVGFIAILLVVKRASVGDLLKAAVAFGVIMLALFALIKSFQYLAAYTKVMGIGKVLTAAASLMLMAVALDIAIAGFVLLALAMKKIDAKTLIKSIVAFASVALALTVMSKALAKVSPGIRGSISMVISAIALAGIMVAFALVLKHIKDVKTETIISFALGIAAILAAFALISIAGTVAGPGGILVAAGMVLAIGAALGILVAAIVAILNIPGVDLLLQGAAEKIGRIVGTFTGAMKAADMKAFSKGMDGFKDISEADEGAVNNAIKCAQLLADFSAGLPVGNFFDRAADFLFGSALENFSGDMVTFSTAFNAFAKEMNKVDEIGDLEGKVTAAVKIAGYIRDFNNTLPEGGNIIDKAATFLFGSEMEVFSGDMTAFAEGFNAFAIQMGAINPVDDLSERVTSAVQIAEAIRDLNASLPEGGNIIDKAATFLFGSEMEVFSGDMTAFAEGFNAFAIQMGAINPVDDLSERVTSAVQIAEAIRDLNASLPEGGNIIDKAATFLFGSEMEVFSGDMTAFAEGFNAFAQEISKVDVTTDLTDKISSTITIAEAIRDFNSSLPEGGDILDKAGTFLFGTKQELFNGDMLQFADGFNQFAQEMAKIDYNAKLEKDTANAVKIATQVANFLTELNSDAMNIEHNKGALDKWFNGDTSQGTVFDSLKTLATSMNDASTAFAEVNANGVADNITSAVNAARSIAELLNYLGGDEFNASNNLLGAKTMLGEIESLLGEKKSIPSIINKFISQLDEGVDLNAFASAMNAITEFANMLSGQGDVKISTDDFLGDLDAGAVVEKLSTFTSSLTESLSGSATDISTQATAFNTAGSDLANAVSAGMGSATIDTSGLESAIQSSVNNLAKYQRQFVAVGGNFGAGLAQGIRNSQAVAEAAARAVALAMLNAAKTVLNINSPSREAAKLGSGFDEGLGKGMTDSMGSVVKTSETVAESMLSTARGSLSSLSSILADDIDDTPVIKPVVDLTNARAAAGSIGGMFGTQTFGVQTAAMANSAAQSASKRAAANQNGSATSGSASGTVNTNTNAVNLSGNNFYIRSEQDVHSLASEIATLSRQQQRSYGATV